MRLISQCGTTDLPYDRVAVLLEDEESSDVIAFDVNDVSDGFWTMGSYSSHEKAMSVMNMLRKAYKNFVFETNRKDRPFLIDPIFQFPADNEVLE